MASVRLDGVPLHDREHNHKPQSFGKLIHRAPETLALLFIDGGLFNRRAILGGHGDPVARHPATTAPHVIERHPPGHAHEPGTKTIPVAQLCKGPMGFGKRLLRHILGVRLIAQDGKGHTNRQR